MKSPIKFSFANIKKELIETESFLAEEVLGDWVTNLRLGIAKYLKGIRNREVLSS